jgi:uncharacterized protein (TIGR03435 family)
VTNVLIALCVYLPLAAATQQAGPASFEVASIKANTSGAPKPWIENDPGRIMWTNVTLQYCIKIAYGVNDYQISGPAWLTSEHYDVNAKAAEPMSGAQRNRMLQALLADRFKLVVHRETKQGRVFALIVARGGPKFQESKGDPALSRRPPNAEGLLILRGETMARLANILSVGLRAPVVDETGLTARYDLNFDIRPFSGSDNEPTDVPAAIVGALQSELGLRLAPNVGPVESLVVDNAERVPSGN